MLRRVLLLPKNVNDFLLENATFSVSFIVTIFVPDIEIVQKKVICL